jgi:hypothetical protein
VTDEPAEQSAGPPEETPAEPVPSPEEIAGELDAAAEEHLAERRYPSTIGGAFYLGVLALAAIGIALVWAGDWRIGIQCLAAGLCFAAVMRLVLPVKDAGMLAVRNRLLDATLLAGAGIAIFFLLTTIPNQPS